MKDWFPSKKLIDEKALMMKEAYDKGFEAEYQNKQKALAALLFSDVMQKDGIFYTDKIAYDIFIKLLSENIIDKWAKNKNQENLSFVGYLAVSISSKAKVVKQLVRNGYDSDIAVTRKQSELNNLVTDIYTNEEGEDSSIFDKMSAPEMMNDIERLDYLRSVLDRLKLILDKTRQKNSKICNRTFSSESFMLKYIPYSDGKLLKEVSNQFEAVTYYSLFGFLMVSDIIDPATVDSIDDIFKCYVHEKYYTQKGNEKEMIPHSDTCAYLKKFHNIEKTPAQLSDNYVSYQGAIKTTFAATE